jgi:hypothetical protein
VLFTLELQRRLVAGGSRVRAVSAHPGIARTNLGAHIRGMRGLAARIGGVIGQDIEHGALISMAPHDKRCNRLNCAITAPSGRASRLTFATGRSGWGDQKAAVLVWASQGSAGRFAPSRGGSTLSPTERSRMDAGVSEILDQRTGRTLAEGTAEELSQYAQASSAVVRLREDGDKLRVEVSDDGRGFDVPASRGNGLTNMEDRPLLPEQGAATDVPRRFARGVPRRPCH